MKFIFGLLIASCLFGQQLDYNTQIGNLPDASAIKFQQPGGIPSTVQAALRYCPFDVQYTTLARAVANIPAYGCLNVVGTWTLTDTVTVSASNVQIYGQSGSLIKLGASSISAFTVSGANVSITGITVDGQYSQSGFTGSYGVVGGVLTGLHVEKSTFRNLSVSGITVSYSCLGCYFGRNAYTNIGTGVPADNAGLDVNNPDRTLIEYEVFTNMTSGNFMHLHSIASGSEGLAQSVTVDHCMGYGAPNRLGFEASMFQTTSLKFTNNHAEGTGWPFSLTMQNYLGTPITTDSELLISGNSAIWAGPALGYACIEEFSNYATITNNTCVGPFGTGIVYSNGGDISGNRITGATNGMSQDSSDQTSYIAPLLITHNRFSEIKNISIWPVNRGAISVSDNSDYRTPGYFAGDATGVHIFIDAAPQSTPGGVSITNNHGFINAPISPLQNWYGIFFNNYLDGSVPHIVTGNSFVNLGTVPFGTGLVVDNGVKFTGVSAFNNTFTGMASINTGTASLTRYAGNLSTIGNVPAINITAATNASPIAITSASPHGRTTGDTVFVAGIVGNTAANNTEGNPYWTVTVTGASTLTLNGAIGNAAYSSGGTIAYLAGSQIITPYYPVATNKFTTSPTCVTGPGMDGVGGVNCNAFVVGTPYYGEVTMDASGVPVAGSTAFTLTFPVGAFTAYPFCTFSSNYVFNDSAIMSKLAVVRTGVATTATWSNYFGGPALTSGAHYWITYSCQR